MPTGIRRRQVLAALVVGEGAGALALRDLD
jgi:hypothetical protein